VCEAELKSKFVHCQQLHGINSFIAIAPPSFKVCIVFAIGRVAAFSLITILVIAPDGHQSTLLPINRIRETLSEPMLLWKV
jgi:hypothetical protein